MAQKKKSLFYSRICIPCSEGYKVINQPEICFIQSHDTFCKIFRATRNIFDIAPIRLTDIETDLRPDLFCKIHRAYIVSLDHILEFNKTKTRVRVTGDTWLPVGRVYKHTLLKKYKWWKS